MIRTKYTHLFLAEALGLQALPRSRRPVQHIALLSALFHVLDKQTASSQVNSLSVFGRVDQILRTENPRLSCLFSEVDSCGVLFGADVMYVRFDAV